MKFSSTLILGLLFSLFLIPNFFSASVLQKDSVVNNQRGLITLKGNIHIYGSKNIYISNSEKTNSGKTAKIDSQNINPKYSENILVLKGTSIYVAKNVVFSGNIFYAEPKPDLKVLKKKLGSEDLLKKAIAQKKEDKKETENHKENIAEKFNFQFSSLPFSDSNFSQKSVNSIKAVFTPSNLLQKSTISNVNYKIITLISSELKKQKFYTLSYLQFTKYASSSLRGPPRFL